MCACNSECTDSQNLMHQVCLLPVEKKMRVAVLLWDWWATQNKTNAGTKQKTIEEASMLINKHLLEFSSMKLSPSPQPACQESRKPPEADRKDKH